MADQPTTAGNDPEHIDIDDEQQLRTWAGKLDATPEQIKEAVAAVGRLAADVEMHLKGTHSTTNAERQAQAESTDSLR